MIDFIVSKLHVSTTDRKVIAEIRKRLNRNVLGAKHRMDRFAMYHEALRVHHANQELYDWVMSGGHGYTRKGAR